MSLEGLTDDDGFRFEPADLCGLHRFDRQPVVRAHGADIGFGERQADMAVELRDVQRRRRSGPMPDTVRVNRRAPTVIAGSGAVDRAR